MPDSHTPYTGCEGKSVPPSGPDGWFSDALHSASDLDLVFDSPEPPESRLAPVNGICIRYLDWGNGHLPDLLFIHGFAQQAHSWDFAALAVQDLFHVVALDLRGHGESDRSPTGIYSFDDLYADLDAFIAAVCLERPVLCGLSLGGTLAYTYASRNPDQTGALVIAESAPESRREGRQAIQSFTSGSGEFDSLEQLVEKVRLLTPHRSADQVRRSLVHSVGQRPSGKWGWKYDPAISTLHSSYGSSELRWQAIEAIRTPTLLIRGEDSDITSPEIYDRMAALIEGSEIASVPNAGHRVSGDNPSEFNSALRGFLSGQLDGLRTQKGS